MTIKCHCTLYRRFARPLVAGPAPRAGACARARVCWARLTSMTTAMAIVIWHCHNNIMMAPAVLRDVRGYRCYNSCVLLSIVRSYEQWRRPVSTKPWGRVGPWQWDPMAVGPLPGPSRQWYRGPWPTVTSSWRSSSGSNMLPLNTMLREHVRTVTRQGSRDGRPRRLYSHTVHRLGVRCQTSASNA